MSFRIGDYNFEKLESDGSQSGVLVHSSVYSQEQDLEQCLGTFCIVITGGGGGGVVGGQHWHLMNGGQGCCFNILQYTGWPPTPLPARNYPIFRIVELRLRNSGLDFFFFLINFTVYLFIYGCVGSSFLCEGFLLLR